MRGFIEVPEGEYPSPTAHKHTIKADTIARISDTSRLTQGCIIEYVVGSDSRIVRTFHSRHQVIAAMETALAEVEPTVINNVTSVAPAP